MNPIPHPRAACFRNSVFGSTLWPGNWHPVGGRAPDTALRDLVYSRHRSPPRLPAICIALVYSRHRSPPMLPAICTALVYSRHRSPPVLPAICIVLQYSRPSSSPTGPCSAPRLPATDGVRHPILLAICIAFVYNETNRSPPKGPVRHPRGPKCETLTGNHESHFGRLII